MENLPDNQTCQVFWNDKLIFSSESHWLHPLFELNDFLNAHETLHCPPARDELFLQDRIIGRAAALMIVKLGIIHCTAPLISERALPILSQYQISADYNEIVPRLPCQTEDILAEETDPVKAWNILAARAASAKEARRDQ